MKAHRDIEIDSELVQKARENVQQAGIAGPT